MLWLRTLHRITRALNEGLLMTKVVLRIDFDEKNYIGHGRIELLELVGTHGSIARAAKAMGMSYKRAWYLLEDFNASFREPLIERHQGGRGGGSAKLTAWGAEVIRRYRAMESKAMTACRKDLAALDAKIIKPRQRTGN